MTHHQIRSSFIAAAAASSLLLAAYSGGAGAASSSTQNWKYADYLQPKNSIAVGINDGIFAPLEKDKKINIKKYYQESLLKATDILRGVAQSRADLGFTIVLYYPGDLPLSQLASVPYLATNGEAQTKAYNKLYAENKAFKAEYDKAGVHVITFTPLGGTIIGGKKKWDNIADLKGQSIRAAGYVANALKLVGAEPVAITAPEVYDSIDRGVIQGYSSYPFDIAIAGSLQEVTPYFMDAGLGQYNLGMLIMAKQKWDALPADIKTKIEDQVNGDYFPIALEKLKEGDTAACKAVAKSGSKIVMWSDQNQNEFKNIIGTKFVDSWKAASIKAGVSSADVNTFYDDYQAAYKQFAAKSQFKAGMVACQD